MKINIPKKVNKILETLKYYGYEAFIVGGCVRDSFLGITPKDWDITTNAKPDQLISIFPICIQTGIEHGTVTVVDNKEMFEITTYRIDGLYSDYRHPDNIEYTSDLIEDLKRRDFTINAMAYNEKDGLIDPFDGCNDLHLGLIRCVGDPLLRFNEDALRILRAIRFSSRFNYLIECKTLNAMKNLSYLLVNISKERIRDEIIKTIESNNPYKLDIINDIDALDYIYPDIKVTKKLDYNKIISFEEIELKLATLIESFYIKDIKNFLHEARLDNKTVHKVVTVLNNKKVYIDSKKDIKLILNKFGLEITKLILKYNYYNMEIYKQYLNLLNDVINNKEPYSRLDLRISGKDLLNMGFKGKVIGYILDLLTEFVIEKPELNDKEVLIQMIDNTRWKEIL